MDRPLGLRAVIEQLKKHLNIPRGMEQLEVAEAYDPPEKYECVGLCAGAGGSLFNEAVKQGCRLFFTGEMRHHDVLAAQSQGCTVILAGHTNTERGYLKPLRKRLMAMLAGVGVEVSKRDEHPLRAM
jgi:putative NIF3 family GTP cyclohydrolase 1 type 2